MSHDRGCFRCFEDDKSNCGRQDCPYARVDRPQKEKQDLALDWLAKQDQTFELINDLRSEIERLLAREERLREALTMFVMFYPFGVSLELDQAFRTARAALGDMYRGSLD